MIRTWPRSLAGRAHLSKQLLGEVMLAVLLTASVAFYSRDAIPEGKFVYDLDASQTGFADVLMPGNNLSGTKSARPVVEPPPPPPARVPTAAPVQLLIPLLDVHRAVEKVGVDQYGVLNLPVNSWNAGWFKNGPVPGAPGDAVIEGHAGAPGKPMIFGKLGTMRPGDKVIVVLADGSRHLFTVVSMRSVPAGTALPGLGSPYGLPRLTLITCTGHFDKKSFWYSERLLVETRYAGLA